MIVVGRAAVNCALFWMLTKPAGCGDEVVTQTAGGGYTVHPWVLAKGAPSVLKSTPDEAVVSLETMVLLMKFTANASNSETPAPSQPATLLEIILLVTFTLYH